MTWYVVPDTPRPEWDLDGCKWAVANRKVPRGELGTEPGDDVIALTWTEEEARRIAALLNLQESGHNPSAQFQGTVTERYSEPWSE